MKQIILISLFISYIICGDIIYRSVHYPNVYTTNKNALNSEDYIASANLLYTIVIYNNGTVFTVGNSTHTRAEQTNDYKRVIYRYELGTSRVSEFNTFVRNLNFVNDLPAFKQGDRSNLICDTLFINSYSSHEVCRPEEKNPDIIQQIDIYINRMLSYRPMEYDPPTIFVETKKLISVNLNGRKTIRKTSTEIFKELDPNGRYMDADYSTNRYVPISAFNTYFAFKRAINNYYIYVDGLKYYQFIGYVPGLSVSTIPYPSPFTSSYTYDKWDDNNSTTSVLLISFVALIIIFFSLCLAFVIKRKLKGNQNRGMEELQNYENETSDDDDDQQPIQQIPTYPVFLQSNNVSPMMSNGGIPVFVATNPNVNGFPMQTNVPIMFPQPTVFYPVNTNQN